ncbi:hypothetical protein GLOTRDRAFT_96481 [Gloeophyllum trabeum ATCC 11539]|uniref:Uncharacterized protein n=1 Tax=Gloeophyllum trabeum (strain ATCC 11539 / FP-39264 / Madison 617) TaxID=670483 RepID=S7PV67_GLOTA|nr:uncharacterized protein GLOTRDRAFT_96481 [Gloeophyllum trabeum ATCC 11539]EPQ51307.1 hypothetical protein GLOTRDRAFT_96481 [Gloeophyllum trabeum ATCC 11539]
MSYSGTCGPHVHHMVLLALYYKSEQNNSSLREEAGTVIKWQIIFDKDIIPLAPDKDERRGNGHKDDNSGDDASRAVSFLEIAMEGSRRQRKKSLNLGQCRKDERSRNDTKQAQFLYNLVTIKGGGHTS